MIGRLFLTALIAGLLAGLFMFAAHMLLTSPLIAHAEHYETVGNTSDHHAKTGNDGHDHSNDWFPENGLERSFYTLLADILTSVGFAVLLTGVMAVRNRNVDWRRGMIWGLCGFAAFFVAPSLGMAPELPGMQSGVLQDRQVWWLVTVALTGAGLAALFFGKGMMLKAAGVVAILMPHVIGAPEHHAIGNVPAALAAEFVVATFVSSGLFWLLLGGLTGWLHNRFEHFSVHTKEYQDE